MTKSSSHPEDRPESKPSSRLLQRVRLHDQEAWRELVQVTGPLVWHWIRRADLQTADGNDVFQEVFQAVAMGIHKLQNDESFCGWLRVVTQNKIHDFHRRHQDEPTAQGGTVSQLDMYPAPRQLQPESADVTAWAELRRRALDVVKAEFESRTWDMFWATVVEERPTKLVAREYAVTASAVRLAKSRVLRRLREELSALEP